VDPFAVVSLPPGFPCGASDGSSSFILRATGQEFRHREFDLFAKGLRVVTGMLLERD
jgi:hypothetical protein